MSKSQKYCMKNILITLILGIVMPSCSTPKTVEVKTRYFDENNLEITEAKFNQIRSTHKFLEIPGDSIHHKKLTQRGQRGQIDNRPALELALEQATQTSIEADKPIVILYYPGDDPCYSSSSLNIKLIKTWHDELQKGVYEMVKVKPIYIYKNDKGLKKILKLVDGKKDPNGIIEKLFFKYHYPCISFVVISKDGQFVSYFGEFGKEYVWGALKLLNEEVK